MNIELFTTAPQSVDFESGAYLEELKRISSQTERNGYKGMLVYSDNRLADPWMVTNCILANTTELLPMVALQPVYMHPYTVAKKISTIGLLYDRPIALNLVAGGFVNDLKALGDKTEHDQRYVRLCEYAEIIQLLLTSKKPVSYRGEYYKVEDLTLAPRLPEHLQPHYYLSGSSNKARATAKRLSAKLIEYPEHKKDYSNSHKQNGHTIRGIRIGILTRNNHDDAWEQAVERFPETRVGKMTHQYANKVSDSEWHHRLTDQGEGRDVKEPVYWLGPFKHYHTFCPYLVGSYDEVSEEISGYLEAGCTTCILDIPISEEELQHTRHVFNEALQIATE